MEISRRYKIYLAIVVTTAIVLTIRWAYYHNKWRTIEVRNGGYQISYPAHWFNSTHKAIRGPVGKWISFEATNLPFVNSIMIRTYDDIEYPTDEGVEHWELEIIKKDGCESWSPPRQIQISPIFPSGIMTECVDDVKYHRKIAAFSHNGHLYAVELLTFAKQWQRGNEIFEKVLESFQFLE